MNIVGIHIIIRETVLRGVYVDRTGRNTGVRNNMRKECYLCGVEFVKKGTLVTKTGRFFCSNSHHGEYISILKRYVPNVLWGDTV